MKANENLGSFYRSEVTKVQSKARTNQHEG